MTVNRVGIVSVWPDLTTFRHFGKILKYLSKFITSLFSNWWNIGEFLILLANFTLMLNLTLVLWSHWIVSKQERPNSCFCHRKIQLFKNCFLLYFLWPNLNVWLFLASNVRQQCNLVGLVLRHLGKTNLHGIMKFRQIRIKWSNAIRPKHVLAKRSCVRNHLAKLC